LAALGNEHRLIRADPGDRAGDPPLRNRQEGCPVEPRCEPDRKARGERRYGGVIGGVYGHACTIECGCSMDFISSVMPPSS